MKRRLIRGTRWLVSAVVLVGAAACGDLLKVSNPDVIDASTLDANDPVVLDVFARSAQTAFGSVYGDIIRFGGIFTTEVQYVATSEPEGQFAVRSVSAVNLQLPPTLWGPLSSTRVQADGVLRLIAAAQPSVNYLNGARAALFAGYSMVLMGESFCAATLANVTTREPGNALTSAEVLDTAVARFTQAMDLATRAKPYLTATQLAEANSFIAAAQVGRARAQLQRGNLAAATTDAAAVPAGFVLNMQYVDDAANRTRVSNRLWQFTALNGQLSVAPAYRALADPRVPFQNPVPSLPAVDGSPLFAQQKYTTLNAPIRLASKLEADYIAAEAQLPNTAPALALIAARRTSAGKGAYTGGTDAPSVLRELMDQRGREFYLEGKRLGDLRRAATYGDVSMIQQMLPTGATYFTRPNLGPVGTQTCWTLPESETANNPNFPRG